MPSIAIASSVSAPKSSLSQRLHEVGLSQEKLDPWLADLRQSLQQIRETPSQGAGFIEETICQRCRELERHLLQDALQKQADSVAVMCPKCVHVPLTGRWRQKSRPLRTLCGPVCVTRSAGYCKKCDDHYYPADARLGLSGESTASPLLQEVSALLVSKMPAEQAEEISQGVCGIRLNDASLARDARRQGERAIEIPPLLQQVRSDQTPAVITELKELLPTLTAAQAKKVNTTVEYYTNNLHRMKYTEADLRNEPVWSGTIESTCRQYQCRMKRCGQFWSQQGDEALLTLTSFWKNGYWDKLFPHAQLASVSRN